MQKSIIAALLATTLTATGALALSEGEQSAALTALDDEYKAFATYTVVLEKFGDVRPFTSIMAAEADHISKLVTYLNAQGLEVPANPYLDGTNPRPNATETLQDACEIGIEAEIANAALYNDDLLPRVNENSDLTAIFESLRDASTNKHLPAFTNCATN